MYPYDDNLNDESASGTTETGAAPEGEYSIVRPDAGRSWRDAEYTPTDETTVPPRYYEPPAEKPKKEKQPREKGRMSFAGVACLCLVCALIGGLAGGAVGGGYLASPTPPAEETPLLASAPTPTTQISSIAAIDGSSIYKLGCEQVVGVTTEIITQNFFGMTSPVSVSGSGFILTEDGYIMTNYHVIKSAYQGGYEIKVMLHSGEEYAATIVGFDDDYDIAVLKIDAIDLSPVALGNSDEINVGDTVFAIGNPLGELAYTMTSGIISGTDRLITTSEGTNLMFQFDAAVNEGNSGGPVYDAKGQVVGVVTAKHIETGVEGLGFAVPINDAIRLANDLMSKGYVSGKAYMGINGEDVSAAAVQYYNMPKGLYLTYVAEGSAAQKAGLKIGDIITALDGVATGSMTELRAAIKTHSAGDTCTITIYRSGEYLDLSITFDEQPQQSVESSPQQRQQPQYQQYYQQMLPDGYGW